MFGGEGYVGLVNLYHGARNYDRYAETIMPRDSENHAQLGQPFINYEFVRPTTTMQIEQAIKHKEIVRHKIQFSKTLVKRRRPFDPTGQELK